MWSHADHCSVFLLELAASGATQEQIPLKDDREPCWATRRTFERVVETVGS